MVDFEKMIREHYERATPEERAAIDRRRKEQRIDEARPRARVDAVRTSCTTGKETVVQITFVVRPGHGDRDWFFIDDGGPTGYESIPVASVRRAIEEGKGWSACHGTEGRWDGLFVPLESLRAALAELVPRPSSARSAGLVPPEAG